MKKTIVILIMVLFIFSCERDNYTGSEEIPSWLQTRIAKDEEEIRNNPQSGLNIAAWIRYSFNDKYYFEYRNLLSSMGPVTYSFNGSVLDYQEIQFVDYMTNRCCKYYIWKGPAYFGN